MLFLRDEGRLGSRSRKSRAGEKLGEVDAERLGWGAGGVVRLAGCLLKFSRRDLWGNSAFEIETAGCWRSGLISPIRPAASRGRPISSRPFPWPLLMSPLQYLRKLEGIMTDWWLCAA